MVCSLPKVQKQNKSKPEKKCQNGKLHKQILSSGLLHKTGLTTCALYQQYKFTAFKYIAMIINTADLYTFIMPIK